MRIGHTPGAIRIFSDIWIEGDGNETVIFWPTHIHIPFSSIFLGRINLGDSERSEEHTSELQSPCNLVCRLLLEKKKQHDKIEISLARKENEIMAITPVNSKQKEAEQPKRPINPAVDPLEPIEDREHMPDAAREP